MPGHERNWDAQRIDQKTTKGVILCDLDNLGRRLIYVHETMASPDNVYPVETEIVEPVEKTAGAGQLTRISQNGVFPRPCRGSHLRRCDEQRI